VKTGGHTPVRRVTGFLFLSILAAGCGVDQGATPTTRGGQGPATTFPAPATTSSPFTCPPSPTGTMSTSSVGTPTGQPAVDGMNLFAYARGTFTNPRAGISPAAMMIEIVVSYVPASKETATTLTFMAHSPTATGPYTSPGATSEWVVTADMPNVEPDSQPVVKGFLVGWTYLSPSLYRCDHDLPEGFVPPNT